MIKTGTWHLLLKNKPGYTINSCLHSLFPILWLLVNGCWLSSEFILSPCFQWESSSLYKERNEWSCCTEVLHHCSEHAWQQRRSAGRESRCLSTIFIKQLLDFSKRKTSWMRTATFLFIMFQWNNSGNTGSSTEGNSPGGHVCLVHPKDKWALYACLWSNQVPIPEGCVLKMRFGGGWGVSSAGMRN